MLLSRSHYHAARLALVAKASRVFKGETREDVIKMIGDIFQAIESAKDPIGVLNRYEGDKDAIPDLQKEIVDSTYPVECRVCGSIFQMSPSGLDGLNRPIFKEPPEHVHDGKEDGEEEPCPGTKYPGRLFGIQEDDYGFPLSTGETFLRSDWVNLASVIPEGDLRAIAALDKISDVLAKIYEERERDIQSHVVRDNTIEPSSGLLQEE